MSQPPPSAPRRPVAELVIFVLASGVGIYALGTGLNGLFEPGQPVSLGWLAIAGVALMVLVTQMSRVSDHWPHRPTTPAPGQRPRLDAEANGSTDPGRSA